MNQLVEKLFIPVFIGVAISIRAGAQTNSTPATNASLPTVETLVCIRHGEKPAGGLGQLNCRGLNRALALPNVLLARYGTPQYIFAPNPAEKIDGIGKYYYVRPLMTIEPTAVHCGLPVNTHFGFSDIGGLQHELQKSEYKNATVFIAWEHVLLDEFAKDVVKTDGGNPSQVPSWAREDFDSIFVIKITDAAGKESVTFTVDHEGLNNLSGDCP